MLDNENILSESCNEPGFVTAELTYVSYGCAGTVFLRQCRKGGDSSPKADNRGVLEWPQPELHDQTIE